MNLVIGAGPSGLAAAYELSRRGAGVTVLEKLDQVGGLARTIKYDQCLFDVGPHRFYTKNEEVQQLYKEILAEDIVTVPRLTRILYSNYLFNYPLTPINVMKGLGPVECAHVLTDYALSRGRQLIHPRAAQTFEDWVTQKFGTRLYEAFFKTYTEKVWGIDCTNISSDWAAQRIKSLSLPQAVLNAVFRNNGRTTVKSIIDEFLFPRLGSGQLYEKMSAHIAARGGTVRKGWKARCVRREGERILGVLVENSSGQTDFVDTEFLLSSAPLSELIEMMDPAPPDDVLTAGRALRFREHVAVQLQVEGSPFPDNWIYVHSKEVRMARVSNYQNFSKMMAGSGGRISPLTVEYFAFQDDLVWNSPDGALIDLATAELKKTNLLQSEKQVLSGFVVRSKKAYPVMELGYERHTALIKSWLDRFQNLLPIGRSGMFKYNNQDHAIATGLLAARTAMGLAKFDPWLVNIDAEYLEGSKTT